MSQQQDLKAVVNSLPDTDSTANLQARLDAAGIETDLHSVPAGQVGETFRTAISTLLQRPIGELSLDQIRAVTAEVKVASAALEPTVTATSILEGFKKLENGVIELTLPQGTSIQEAGEILNAAARAKGMQYPVFYEGNKDFWQENEANDELQTVPGKTYQFRIPTDSVFKTRAPQVRDPGQGAPLGAIAIAEACERLNTENSGTLFNKTWNGEEVLVRGSASGVALFSDTPNGVFVFGSPDDFSFCPVAFASSVSARN